MTTATHPATIPPTEDLIEVRTADGRRLTALRLGAEHGDVVVVLDGPGSRGMARIMAPVAAELGLRLLAPDRPGFFTSDAAPGRTLADWPADHTALLDAVGAPRAGIIGHSGGTPYALAAAAALGHRTTAVALLGAVGPVAGDRPALAELGKDLRVALQLGRRAPWLLRAGLRATARRVARDPSKAARRLIRVLPPADQEQLRDPVVLELHERSSAEVLRHPEAMAAEIALLARPWGIDLTAVTAPVAFWSGGADRAHPTSHSHRLARRLGGATVHEVPDSATFGLRPRFPEVLRHAAGRGAA